jgi:uncharacterized protein (DUF302 family)
MDGAAIQTNHTGGNQMELLYVKQTTHSVDAMEERLKTAAKNHEFSVLNTTDLRAKLQSNDLEFPAACKVLDVCNPHRAKAVLDGKMEISTALPCRISVYEEGGATKIATLLPSKVLGMFGAEGLDAVAESVERDLIAIIDEAAAE